MFDLFNNTSRVNAVQPKTYKANVDADGAVIDTQTYESVLLVLGIGAVTDAQTLVVQKGNAADMSDGVNVVAADVLGDLADFKAVGANDDGKVKAIQWKRNPNYRYLKITCTGAGATGAAFSVVALRGHGRFAGKTDFTV